MPMLWWQAAFLLLTSTAVWFDVAGRRRRLRAWQDAVTGCGLRVMESSTIPRLIARAGPVEILIEPRHKGLRVTVLMQGPPGSAGIKIRRELHKPPGAREIELGDEPFDGTFFVEGPARAVGTLLDGEMRRLLAAANQEGELEVAAGTLRIDAMDSQLSRVLPLLLAIGRRWSQPLDVAQRLAENARQDPAAGVRLWNLRLLIREFPGDPQVDEALHAARIDASPRVRLRAALELKEEGRDLLVALAANPEDDDASAQAVSLLGAELPFERARASLIQSLRRRHRLTARACLATLGHSAEPAAVETLAKVMAREKGDLAVAAALALGTTGAAAAEPPLLQALQRDRADLRVAAATALARVGSAAAVLPLKEAAERAARDQDLRRAIRQAVAEIQGRLQGASPGQLSLSGADAGQLSLAPGEAGQLSLAPHPGGQLSLPPEKPPA